MTIEDAPLPEQMRWAIEVLRRASERNNWGATSPWTPTELRRYADGWEAEDRAAAEREQQVEELARTHPSGVARYDIRKREDGAQ